MSRSPSRSGWILRRLIGELRGTQRVINALDQKIIPNNAIAIKRIMLSALVIPVALIVVILPVVLMVTSSISSSISLEMQQAVAFNAKEFGERMGRFIGAGLALGLAGVGAGIAVGLAGAAAISAFTEKPEVFGRSFLIVVLGEGIAIYGIAIAILVLILGVP